MYSVIDLVWDEREDRHTMVVKPSGNPCDPFYINDRVIQGGVDGCEHRQRSRMLIQEQIELPCIQVETLLRISE
jgi:hypothetical protein